MNTEHLMSLLDEVLLINKRLRGMRNLCDDYASDGDVPPTELIDDIRLHRSYLQSTAEEITEEVRSYGK